MKKSTLIPLVLLGYLGVMSYIGYPGYQSGLHSPLFYFGVIVVTLVIIALLHFNLKKREQLRSEREKDLRNHQ